MKLNEICEVYSGYAIKEFNNIKKGLPVIKIGNILTDGTLNLGECQFSTEDINEKYHSKKGDIYVALSGATTGKLGIMEDEKKYIINQRVGIIRLKQKSVSQSYIKFFLLKQTERIIDEATGCAQPNISPKQIGEYDVPVFPEKEMLQISDILNNIVCVIKHYKAMIKKYDDLIKARFIEMFGDPVLNERKFPTLSGADFFKLSNGRAVPDEKRIETGIPAYGGNGISWYTDEFLMAEDTIVVGRVGFQSGNVHYVIGPLWITDNAMYISQYDKDKFNLRFLCELMQHVNFSRFQDAGDLKKITQKPFMTFKYILPSMDLQQKFVNFKIEVDKSRFDIKKSITELEREVVYD